MSFRRMSRRLLDIIASVPLLPSLPAGESGDGMKCMIYSRSMLATGMTRPKAPQEHFEADR